MNLSSLGFFIGIFLFDVFSLNMLSNCPCHRQALPTQDLQSIFSYKIIFFFFYYNIFYWWLLVCTFLQKKHKDNSPLLQCASLTLKCYKNKRVGKEQSHFLGRNLFIYSCSLRFDKMMTQLAGWNVIRNDNKLAVGQTHKNKVENFHRITLLRQTYA